MVNTLLRVSAVLAFWNIFGVNKQYKLFYRVLMILTGMHGLSLVMEQLLICRPLHSAWDPVTNGSCGNEVAAYVALEVLGLGLDMAILIQPLYCLKSMQLALKQKLLLGLMLSSGSL